MYGLTHVVHPFQPMPPHWLQRAAAQAEDVLPAVGVMVDVVRLVAVSVVVMLDDPPPPPTVPPVSFTVTTPLAGTETVTLPAEANVAVLLVAQAEAAVGVKSVKASWADWPDVPLFVNTTTTEPSVLTKAPS
jgi:hypothetical protein